ncbi:MAG: hypothetical protein ACR2P1_02295, partial [Pseudomonadales bacterium]
MLKIKRLTAAFFGCLLAATVSNFAIADHHEDSSDDASNGLAPAAQDSEQITAPLEVKFSRAFGAPADGSWDGLFSGDNVLDPAKYATEKPEKTIFKSAQYALSSTTAGDEIWYGSAASVWCYWPYVSMKMPLTLMNHETPHHGCQMTPPSGQRPTGQIYFHNVKTNVTTHVGPNTIKNGEQFLQDSSSRLVELSSIEAMQSIPGFTYRGAGSIDNLTFFAGSNQFPVEKIKAQWLDKLSAEQRAIELKKFPVDFDFDQEGVIGYNRIFVFDNVKKEYLGYAEFFFDTVRRFQTVTHPDGTKGIYWFGGPDQSGGQIGKSMNAMLRWVGTQENPLSRGMLNNGFDIVSDQNFHKYGVVGDFREFEVKGKKHFVSSSWYNPYGEPASMLVSNDMPPNGYTAEAPVVYQTVMKYTDYDPDSVGGHGSKFAANDFFGDYLYFGSYHQGTSGAYDKIMHKYCDEAQIDSLCKLTKYKKGDTEAHREFMMKTWRAAAVFRIKIDDLLATDTPAKDKVELLYGKESDWVFTPSKSAGSDGYDGYKFVLEKNKLGQKPLFGDEGFGHQGMVYTFTVVEHDGKLFMGSWNSTAGLFDMFDHTDYSFWNHRALHMFGLPIPLSPFGQTTVKENNPAYFLYQSIIDDAATNGYTMEEAKKGWLMIFEDTDSPAIKFKDGFGNPCNNGVRNYAKVNGELYLGTTSWC